MDPAAANQAAYEDDDAVGFYRSYAEIQPPERAWLRDQRAELTGSRLLDLGVGGGRTTAFLEPLAATYVGLDYSAALVRAARERCPGVDLRLGDARDLSAFGEADFDVVVFSFNGLDYVDHDDRLRVLAEIHRVLGPGGLFIFASHNRDWRRFDTMAGPGRPRLSRQWLGRLRRHLQHRRRHRQMRAFSVHGQGWSIVNDEAHDYRLMTYYIDKPAQDQQLVAAGFTPLACYRLDGAGWHGTDRDSIYLNYVARRG